LETMERMSLMKTVQAGLIKAGFTHSQFHVEIPEQGLVEVSGYTATEEDKSRMLKTVKKVPGVTKVKDQVGIMPAGGY